MHRMLTSTEEARRGFSGAERRERMSPSRTTGVSPRNPTKGNEAADDEEEEEVDPTWLVEGRGRIEMEGI